MLTLAMIDIDHFKSFNDTWGHQTGDQVIRFIGGAVCALAIPPRTAARYGGKEFVVIMPRGAPPRRFAPLRSSARRSASGNSDAGERVWSSDA